MAYEVPPHTTPAGSLPPHVCFSPDYGAELPLFGLWPEGTLLPEDLDRDLRSWQQQFDENFDVKSGWTSSEVRDRWAVKATTLATRLKAVLGEGVLFEVDLWPTMPTDVGD
jgi:hypothetical protein